jgi:hypothetical protein
MNIGKTWAPVARLRRRLARATLVRAAGAHSFGDRFD